jgi:hypothetical protein
MNGNDIRAIAVLSRSDRVVLANEIDALDAWRDAVCSDSQAGHGCEDGHEDSCPVEIARKALIAASDRRLAL